MLESDHIRVILATTQAEYDKFMVDKALNNRFHKVTIPPVMGCELEEMLRQAARLLSQSHGIQISVEILKYTMYLLESYLAPELSASALELVKDVLDRACGLARVSGTEIT